MEKWKTKGKRSSKTESVLPPTRRPPSPPGSSMEKKKDRKWIFGGLLKRISSGQNNDVSSNDEDITYIPGHMLSKKKVKKTSRMKSKLGKIPHRSLNDQGNLHSEKPHTSSKDTLELIKSLQANIDMSQDSLAPCNDSVNSPSSEGSLDALGKVTRINRMKARAQAKRDRLCGNSSSDDDSHKSNQSLMRFRSDDNIDNAQRIDPSSRRTRGARTERYIKRMYRDDGTSGSDSKLLKPSPLPRSTDLTPSQYSSNSVDSNIWLIKDKPKMFSQSDGSSPSIVASLSQILDKNSPNFRREDPLDKRYLKDMNENETYERKKQTWPGNHRRSSPTNEIYGSLRSTRGIAEFSPQKLLPPEPPPRSSKSRIFSNVYKNPSQASSDAHSVDLQQPCRGYFSPYETRKLRSYNSDNEVLLSDCVAPAKLRFVWQNPDHVQDQSKIPPGLYDRGLYCKKDNCNSLDRTRRSFNGNSAIPRNYRYPGDQENYDPRPYFENATPPPNNFGRSTSSLPKGVQLFSRQRLSHCGDSKASFIVPQSPAYAKSPEDHVILKLRKPRDNCQSPLTCSPKILDNDEAERKRSSKNLEEALSELEAIYNSLRLSDDDLLERAEQRSMEEYRHKAAKNAAEHSLKSCSDASSNEKEEYRTSSSRQTIDPRMKDDMAYRRMNPKDRPPSVNGQASLSNISYLATSPNLSGRETDCFERLPRRRGTPDLTRDDVLYRSITRANNTLKVIEPQPPFGIPLGPVTTATESDYLHVKPSKFGQTRSLYIPKTEPDVVSDDLAFRNLRKDPTRDSPSAFSNKNTNLFVQTDSLIDSCFSPKNTFAFGTKKKRAVRSLSADLYGIMSKETDKRNNDWYNDYIKSTQKLRFVSKNVDETNSNVDNVSSNSLRSEHNYNLDINGNRPKCALQRKMQVYVPQGTSIDEAMAKQRLSESQDRYNEKPRDSMKLICSESEDSSPSRCDSRLSSTSDNVTENDKDKPIESFTEQELSEYKQLCQDLEKLIQRTAEQEDTEIMGIVGNTGEHNSQSEFDELEKLLIDDYELPVRIEAFDETVEATNTEREDDRSSSPSAGLVANSRNSDDIQSSPSKSFKFVDDDASSTSELGNASSNTASSMTDSVYDKFNKLLREVNDVPSVKPTSIHEKYSNAKIGADENVIFHGIDRKAEQSFIGINNDSIVDDNPKNFVEDQTTWRANEQIREAINQTNDLSTDSHEEELASYLDDSHDQPNFRSRNGEARETRSNDDDAKSSYREGETIEDERVCNDQVYYACKATTAMHLVRKLCHVTNSITAYHIVLCSLFLTLLITIIVAQ